MRRAVTEASCRQTDRQKGREKLFVRATGLSGQGGWNPGGSFQYVADVVLGSDLDGASHSPPSSALKTDLVLVGRVNHRTVVLNAGRRRNARPFSPR